MRVKSWVWRDKWLDVGNMGGGESDVGIVSEQVHGGFDGTNYSERVESLDAFGTCVRVVDFGS